MTMGGWTLQRVAGKSTRILYTVCPLFSVFLSFLVMLIRHTYNPLSSGSTCWDRILVHKHGQLRA